VHYAPGSWARVDCVRPSRAPTRGDGFGVKEKKKQARADCVRPSRAPTSTYINSLSPSVCPWVDVPQSVFCGKTGPARTDGRMDKRTYLLFFFVGFFSPSLKLTKMKKHNKK
jgi:hypothetical protein